MIQEYPKNLGKMTLTSQLKRSGVLIIDTLGKLQLAKWRLMSDQIPVKYTTQLPTREELISAAPGLILLQLGSFTKVMDMLNDMPDYANNCSCIVIGKREEEQALKQAFAKGAKGVLTLPLDLPKVSALCRRELDKALEIPQALQLEKVGGKLTAIPVRETFDKAKKPTGKPKLRQFCTAEGLIINTLFLGILLVGLDGKIVLVNQSFNKLLNLPGQSYCGRTFLDVVESLDDPQLFMINKILTDALTKEKTTNDVEIMLTGSDGKPAPGLVNVKIVRNKQGVKTGILLTLNAHRIIKEKQDIRVRSERLAAAGQLAAGAVHEIKNPLTSVRGFIQLLQKELAGNPKAEYIDIIISEIDRVNNIVNEFLKLAKPAAPKRMSCSLAELFEEIRILMESEAFLKNVVIEECFSQLPPVKVDKEQIKQVLINVIQNAFDSMPKGGRLTIKAEPLEFDKKIKIELIDTGCGMSQEVVKRMFDPFFTTKDHGTGLGLSVSQQILESHGGGIEISSTPNQGTVTTIFLPY